MKMATGSPITKKEKTLLLGGLLLILLVCLFGAGSVYGVGSLRLNSTQPPTRTSPPTMPQLGTVTSAKNQITPSATEAPGVPGFVVQVIAYDDQNGNKVPVWQGSGVVLSKDGLILTTNEIARPGKPYNPADLVIAMAPANGGQPVAAFYAEVVQANASLDLAILRVVRDMKNAPLEVAKLDLPFATLGNSDFLLQGSTLTIAGFNTKDSAAQHAFSAQIAGFQSVAGVSQRAFISLDQPLQGEFSGAAAMDENGAIIGIATSQGFTGDGQNADCHPLFDTNRDGSMNEADRCVPAAKKIDALRPIRLAKPLIDAAVRGEVMVLREKPRLVDLPLVGKLLFADSFVDSSNGWTGVDAGGIRAGNANGQFQIGVDPAFRFYATGIQKPFGDVRIDVRTSVQNSVGNGDYGILCRYQDAENFYAMEVSEDGYYSIWKRKAGSNSILIDWTESEGLQNIDGAPTLTATCIGDTISLIHNDTLIGQTKDGSLATGGIGLIAGVWDRGGFSVGFDDMTVRSAGSQPEQPLEVLFKDDFSDAESGWTEDMGAQYFTGGLRLYISRRNVDIWSRAQQNLLNVRLEVDAQKLGGPDNNDFGVLCRYQEGTKAFYFFEISSDGYAVIGYFNGRNSVYLSGKTDPNSNGKFTPASAILKGEAPVVNHLRADCAQTPIGTVLLTFYINGTQVLEVEDDRLLDSGDFGVIAGTFDTGGVDILFDNFIVYKP